MEDLIAESDFFVPIVHAEAQFLGAVAVGQPLTITAAVAALGTTSYTLQYELHDREQNLIGTAKTVHVTVSRSTRAKIPLPLKLRSALMSFRDAD
jgi:1,4-dihydroxy-2-naphthoyl-CoA hydrolase